MIGEVYTDKKKKKSIFNHFPPVCVEMDAFVCVNDCWCRTFNLIESEAKQSRFSRKKSRSCSLMLRLSLKWLNDHFQGMRETREGGRRVV